MVDLPQIIEGGKQIGITYLLLQSDLSKRILGPTADYIGNEIMLFTEKRIKNVKNIFDNAEKKLGPRINDEGSVSPKVLRSIVNEGSYCDDELGVEYFGGLLASSKSEINRDDRASYYISIISKLSTYQLRTHYIFYSNLKRLFDGTNLNICIERERNNMSIYIPMDEYSLAMDFSQNENKNTIIAHSMIGLIKENLLSHFYAMGETKVLKKICSKIEKAGIIFQPSTLGVELFLWAHGRPDLSIQDFFKKDNVFDINIDIHQTTSSLVIDDIT